MRISDWSSDVCSSDLRLLVVPGAANATAVRVEGAALQGELLVPAAKGATIAGRFERVHWRSAEPAKEATTATVATLASVDAVARADAPTAPVLDPDFNPAAIPPLSFDIDDLRVRDAHLGRATLRTHPDRKSTRLNSSHYCASRMTSSAC